MDVKVVTNQLTDELRRSASVERAVNEKRYLKSELDHIGVSVPEIRRAAKRFARERKHVSKLELVSLTHELWRRDVYELRKLAVNIIAAKVDQFDSSDIEFIEFMLRHSHTWALIDDLCINVLHPIFSGDDAAQDIRSRWSKDDDFWVRRTAILSLLPSLRRTTDDWVEFATYADAMLGEEEFFIRKAIGWILREVSKHSPNVVTEWLMPRAQLASSVTMREGIKYLPQESRELLQSLRGTAKSTRQRSQG